MVAVSLRGSMRLLTYMMDRCCWVASTLLSMAAQPPYSVAINDVGIVCKIDLKIVPVHYCDFLELRPNMYHLER